MKRKRLASYTIESKLLDDFTVIATVKNDIMSKVVEEAIRDYVVKNKAEANEIIYNQDKRFID